MQICAGGVVGTGTLSDETLSVLGLISGVLEVAYTADTTDGDEIPAHGTGKRTVRMPVTSHMIFASVAVHAVNAVAASHVADRPVDSHAAVKQVTQHGVYATTMNVNEMEAV